MDPAPDTTYVVGDNHVFQTDGSAGTILAYVEDLFRGDAHQVPSGKGGRRRLRGGHLLDRAFGGGTEDINLLAMLRDVNRGAGESFGNLENSLRKLLDGEDNSRIDLGVEPIHAENARVPDTVLAGYRIDGGDWRSSAFNNVRK